MRANTDDAKLHWQLSKPTIVHIANWSVGSVLEIIVRKQCGKQHCQKWDPSEMMDR